MKTSVTIACLLAALVSGAQDDKREIPKRSPGEVIPLLVMEDVPVNEAVRNLFVTGFMGNYIFDPRVMNSYAGSQSPFGRAPLVNGRWEDHTAAQVLTSVLRKAHLKLVTNSATTVTRIVFEDEKALPVITVLPATTNGTAIPLIVMDEVPLDQAIINLAKQEKMNVVFDENLKPRNSWLGGQTGILDSSVVLRWQNLTARQALDALLDNYSLLMVESANGSSMKITSRAATAASAKTPAEQAGEQAGRVGM